MADDADLRAAARLRQHPRHRDRLHGRDHGGKRSDDNVECLGCHEELIPEYSYDTIHDPFLRRQCTVCHTTHGRQTEVQVEASASQRLERLRLDCQRQQPPPHSSGPEHDRTKVHCAVLARNLLKALTSRRIVGTAEGPLRIVAGLLFVSGYALLLQPRERALRIATSRTP
jgi:predicted CXXCH cytochrome family protein